MNKTQVLFCPDLIKLHHVWQQAWVGKHRLVEPEGCFKRPFECNSLEKIIIQTRLLPYPGSPGNMCMYTAHSEGARQTQPTHMMQVGGCSPLATSCIENGIWVFAFAQMRGLSCRFAAQRGPLKRMWQTNKAQIETSGTNSSFTWWQVKHPDFKRRHLHSPGSLHALHSLTIIEGYLELHTSSDVGVNVVQYVFRLEHLIDRFLLVLSWWGYHHFSL